MLTKYHVVFLLSLFQEHGTRTCHLKQSFIRSSSLYLASRGFGLSLAYRGRIGRHVRNGFSVDISTQIKSFVFKTLRNRESKFSYRRCQVCTHHAEIPLYYVIIDQSTYRDFITSSDTTFGHSAQLPLLFVS